MSKRKSQDTLKKPTKDTTKELGKVEPKFNNDSLVLNGCSHLTKVEFIVD